jgi:thiamine biosynthesis lipoprotein
MGTIVEITLPKDNLSYTYEIESYIRELEKNINNNTNILNSSKKNIKITFDSYFIDLIKKGVYFSEISDGKFDITIFSILKLYGFPEGPYNIPDNRSIKEAIKNGSFRNININNNMIIKKSDFLIDLGAYAKGWIVDQAIEKMKKAGIKQGIVNAGGDMYCLGDKNGDGWTIGIQNPDNKNNTLSVVKLKNKAVVTSGDYERFFIKDGKKYIHIFNAKTYLPADNYRSVSVIADTTEMADGLSTVFFLMDTKEIGRLCKKYNTPVLLYNLDGSLIKLCGWDLIEAH